MARKEEEYNKARESLLMQQIQALGNLQKVYAKSLAGFFAPAWSIEGGATDVWKYVSTALPIFNEPFQRTAVQLGEAFFQQRRLQASGYIGKPLREAPVASEYDFSELFASLNAVNGVTGAIVRGRKTGNMAQSFETVKRYSSTSVVDASRETFIILSDLDEQAPGGYKRRAKATGCAFCKTQCVALEQGWDANSKSTFHNFCSCSIDTDFSGEPAFKQPWEKAAEDDFNKAKALIENGEAGKRTVETGSQEWKENLLGEISKRPRESDRILVDKVATNSFEALTDSEKERLFKKGLIDTPEPENLDQVRQPFAVEMDELSIKNLSYAYESIAGERKIKE